MKHLMIDLETMGTEVTAPVLAIGAVFFDPDTGGLGERFYGSIQIEDACRYGRPSGGTIAWWMKQSEAARLAVIDGKHPAKDVFEKFHAFVSAAGVKEVKPWGNGAAFDISMLDFAFPRITGQTPPWQFWNVMDCRTIKALAQGITDFRGERAGTHHQALDDAIYQAQWVSHYWQVLRGAKSGSRPEPTPVTTSPALALLA